MSFKVNKTETIVKELDLRFFEIGDNWYREVVATTNMLDAIKTAAEPSHGEDFKSYLLEAGEALIIKEITYDSIKNKKIGTDNGMKKVSVVFKEQLLDKQNRFIVFSYGDY